MSQSTRTIVYAGAVLLVVAPTAWWLSSRPGDNSYPDTPESITEWMCDTCGNLVHLTARQRDEWSRSADHVRRGEEAVSNPMEVTRTVFLCDKCGAFSVVRARKCRRHDEWFVPYRSDGSPAGCPRCAAESGD